MIIIDVREPDEFRNEHIPNSINVPLSDFAHLAPGVLELVRDKSVVFMCRGGARAQMAYEQAGNLGFSDCHEFSVYPGGILAWKEEKKQTISAANSTATLPIIRQVQIAAGLIILIGASFGFLYHPNFFLIPTFVGAGLTFAGVTGTCMMANLLSIAPWNKSGQKAVESQ